MIYSDLQWPTMTERGDLKIRLRSLWQAKMKILEKDKKKKDQGTCVHKLYCMTAQMMTESLIITLGDKFTV